MSEIDIFIEEMNLVQGMLLEAASYGLQAEVVTYALKYMKEEPDISISTAMRYGFNEWIK